MSLDISMLTRTTTRHIDISYRKFTIQDLDKVIEIERLSYQQPWSYGQFKDSLNNINTLANLVLDGGVIVGYCLANICVNYADILNICIHPDYRKKGLGSALLKYQKKQLKRLNIEYIILEVRESNITALLYYEENGFKTLEKRKKYYRNGEDAIIMHQNI